MDPVVHFEIPARDRGRIKSFYTKAFGWKLEELGSDMGGYIVVTTTEVDPQTKRPRKPGAINGGMYMANDNPVGEHMSVVIAVENLDEAIAKVTTSGGTIKGEPYEIPGIGRYVSFVDTEGNGLSMLQPKAM